MVEVLLRDHAREFFKVASAGTDPEAKEGLAPFEIALRDLDARIKTFAVMQTSASNSA